ncbi:MAG TPA: hypothetical protein DDW52_20795 [Planctomycetaceae bacterium]|nr:hypothetical protein [Planctomycetaceae bacterium]
MRCGESFSIALALAAILGILSATSQAQARKDLSELGKQTAAAEEQLDAGAITEAATSAREIQTALAKLVAENSDAGFRRSARRIYQRLSELHLSLELEGETLDLLPSWKELTEKKMPPSEENGVSFSKDVAPWLLAKCGNCHVDQSRGEFSMRSFVSLRRGTPAGVVVFPGSPRDSRLVEVIASGDMPRGGGKVTTAELDELKAWIAQGAKFDGPDVSAPLREYAFAAGSSDSAMQVTRATGDEKVSFLEDVAPILLENCNGCHVGARQASGGLRMDNFQQILTGGDAGAMITAGRPGESLLVRKIRGEAGRRMPAGGRPALSAEQIDAIETWISEGAKYDGTDPAQALTSESEAKWAATASHDALFARRQQQALEQWSRVQPDDSPNVVVLDDLVLVGELPERQMREVGEEFKKAAETIRTRFAVPKSQPLTRGGLSVFVVNTRYDYSEFGQMIESRELPRSWRSHWSRQGPQVYSVALVDAGWTEEEAPAHALHALSGAYFGSYPTVPYWFAEGAARLTVINQFRRGSGLVAAWQAGSASALQRLGSTTELLDDKLDEEVAGQAGLRVAAIVFDRRNRRRYEKFLTALQEGKSFETAFAANYGPLEPFVKRVLGK